MKLILTALAIGPIFLGMMAHDATGGNALAGWVAFLLAATVAGFVLKATNLDR
jgi:TRAP-type mannitol/chloroaromatic compound transport system permease large subunit